MKVKWQVKRNERNNHNDLVDEWNKWTFEAPVDQEQALVQERVKEAHLQEYLESDALCIPI